VDTDNGNNGLGSGLQARWVALIMWPWLLGVAGRGQLACGPGVAVAGRD
jgi:hypothetical protein